MIGVMAVQPRSGYDVDAIVEWFLENNIGLDIDEDISEGLEFKFACEEDATAFKLRFGL